MKRINLVLCILLSMIMLSACGGEKKAAGTGKPSESVPAAAPDNQFLGYWYAADDDENCLAFYEDGTLETLYEGEVDMSGKYKFEGNKATLTMNNENVEATLEGTSLVLTNPDDPDDKVAMKRGTAPKAPAETDEPVDYSVLDDDWYLEGDLSDSCLTLDTAGNFWVYQDGTEYNSGTYTFDGETAYLSFEDGETADLLWQTYDTLYFAEDGDTFVRESACEQEEAPTFEPVASVGDWIDMVFINETSYTFNEIYLYEEVDDTGYNHIASIGSLAPGESCGIGADKYDSFMLSFIDDEDTEWYFTVIDLDEGATVSIMYDGEDPILHIEYSNGYVEEETGSFY